MEVIAALLLGGFFAFNSLATPKRVAKGAEKALRRQFPGATVNVEVKGKKGKDVLNGRFNLLRIQMANLSFDTLPLNPPSTEPLSAQPKTVKVGRVEHLEVQMRNLRFGNLPLERVNIAFDDVRYDFNALKNHSQLHLLSFSNGRIALGVRGSSLVPLFAAREPGMRNPSVAVGGGEIIFSGQRDVLGTMTAVEVRGALVARGQNLEVASPRARVGEMSLPPAAAAPFLRGLNPLFQFDPEDRGPLRFQINSIQTQNDVIEMQGALTLR